MTLQGLGRFPTCVRTPCICPEGRDDTTRSTLPRVPFFVRTEEYFSLVFILLQVCPDIKLEIGVSACGTEKGEGRSARKRAGEGRGAASPRRKEKGEASASGLEKGGERLRRGERRRKKRQRSCLEKEVGGQRRMRRCSISFLMAPNGLCLLPSPVFSQPREPPPAHRLRHS